MIFLLLLSKDSSQTTQVLTYTENIMKLLHNMYYPKHISNHIFAHQGSKMSTVKVGAPVKRCYRLIRVTIESSISSQTPESNQRCRKVVTKALDLPDNVLCNGVLYF